MKTRELAVFGLLMVSIQLLHANGGGYFRGGVENTGNVAGFEPKATENIRILDEKLTVKLGPTEADVEVRYLMKNVSDKKVKVRFGFPVEESFDNDGIDIPGGGTVKENKRLTYCKDYRIAAGGKELSATWEAEKKPIQDKHFRGLAGWLVSEVGFDVGQELSVLIRFQSRYPKHIWSLSSNEDTSASLFKYRLSTAACWAGTIGEGRIRFEVNGINPKDIKFLKPVNRFKKEGGGWIWNFKDLEPTLADDILVECHPEETIRYGRTEDGNYATDNRKHAVALVEREKHWSMIHANYEVTASSTLKPEKGTSYEAANLKERSYENAWSESAPGPGVGEWLELVPKQPKRLSEILIKPGYQKDGLFEANARPKKVKVILNGEHGFISEIPDLREEVSIPVANYDKPVRKIRMTFTEVYPGTRFEDLCVTSISLHALLDKKPKLAPTR